MRILLLALLVPSLGYAAGDRAVRGWSIQNVSVSSTTRTAIPATALTGRFKAVIQDLNPTYDLYIGTSTAMSSTTAFVIQKSSGSAELSVPEGLTIYGLAPANGTTGTIDIRVIEYK